jgi:histidine triad (HIT) family protein
MSQKTIFEKIISGEIPCYKIYEDKNTFAFLDINPKTMGHTLVVPKKPFKNIYEIDSKTNSFLFQNVQKIAIAIKKSLKADGINIIMNNEACAGQIVFHAHIHIVPRFKNDAKKKYSYSKGEAEKISKKIAKNI